MCRFTSLLALGLVSVMGNSGCQQATSPEVAESPQVTDEGAPATDVATADESTPASAKLADAAESTDKAMPAETDEATAAAPATEVTAAKITPPTVPNADSPEESAAAVVEETAEADAEPALSIGDPAPPLSIATWVTGDPVETLEPGKPYVIEFWATWCGPCRTSMPHLADLATRYEDDITVIGVTREDVETVEGFLDKEQSEGKTWRDVVSYRLAVDQDSATNEAYMRAAEQSGIPTAFIVGRDGIIEWIGHPMTMDDPLLAVIDGTFDRDAAIVEFKQRQELKQAQRELSMLLRSGDYDKALEVLATLEEKMGASPQLQLMKLSLLQKAQRHEEAGELRQQLVENLWDQAMGLNQIAWGIVTSTGPQNLDLALKAATRASELTNNTNASILDTLARVYYEQGDLEEAIRWQEKAVEHAGGQRQIVSTLEKYREEIAPTQPADESPETEAASEEKASQESAEDKAKSSEATNSDDSGDDEAKTKEGESTAQDSSEN